MSKRYTVQQAATRAGVSTKTIRRWLKSGRLPFERVPNPGGGAPAYSIDPLELERAQAGAHADPGAVSVDMDGPYLQVSAEGNHLVRSIEDLLRVAEIDPEEWRVTKGQVKTWTSTLKGPDDLPRITRNWGVTAQLERNLSDAAPGIRVVEPVRRKPHIRAEGSRKCLLVPDTQIGFRRRGNGDLEPLHDRRAIDLCLQIAALEQPDCIVWLGDSVDFAEWSTKYPTPPSLMQTSQASLDECYWWLAQFRTTCPSADIVVLEGNHDDRIKRRMVSKAPAAVDLSAVHEEAPALDMARLLALDTIDAEYVGPYPSHYWWGGLRVKHGDVVRAKGGLTVAAEVAAEAHCVAFGHVHRLELASRTLWGPDGPRHVWALSPGCLCRLAPGVVPGVKRHQDWQQGVALVTEQGGALYPELAYIRRGECVWRGRTLQAVDHTASVAEATGHPMAVDWLQVGE